MKYLVVLILIAFAGFSCTNTEKVQENVGMLKDSLQGEIMKVHDEVMPKHLELQKLKKEIDQKIDQIQEDSLLVNNMKEISVLLDSAYRSMNTWMYEYEPMSKEMTKEEILEYYKVEREKIDQVSDLMMESLSRVREILAE